MRGIIPCVFSFDQALMRVEVERAGVERQRRAGACSPAPSQAACARRMTPASTSGDGVASTASSAARVSPVAPARIDVQGPRQAVGRQDDVALEALQQREPELIA